MGRVVTFGVGAVAVVRKALPSDVWFAKKPGGRAVVGLTERDSG